LACEYWLRGILPTKTLKRRFYLKIKSKNVFTSMMCVSLDINFASP